MMDSETVPEKTLTNLKDTVSQECVSSNIISQQKPDLLIKRKKLTKSQRREKIRKKCEEAGVAYVPRKRKKKPKVAIETVKMEICPKVSERLKINGDDTTSSSLQSKIKNTSMIVDQKINMVSEMKLNCRKPKGEKESSGNLIEAESTRKHVSSRVANFENSRKETELISRYDKSFVCRRFLERLTRRQNRHNEKTELSSKHRKRSPDRLIHGRNKTELSYNHFDSFHLDRRRSPEYSSREKNRNDKKCDLTQRYDDFHIIKRGFAESTTNKNSSYGDNLFKESCYSKNLSDTFQIQSRSTIGYSDYASNGYKDIIRAEGSRSSRDQLVFEKKTGCENTARPKLEDSIQWRNRFKMEENLNDCSLKGNNTRLNFDKYSTQQKARECSPFVTPTLGRTDVRGDDYSRFGGYISYSLVDASHSVVTKIAKDSKFEDALPTRRLNREDKCNQWPTMSNNNERSIQRHLTNESFTPSEQITRTEMNHAENQTKDNLPNLPDPINKELILVLRHLSILESHLGSLGPKVLDLLSEAVQTDKFSNDGGVSLLSRVENCIFLETVKERLFGLLEYGLIDKKLGEIGKSVIKKITILMPTKSELSQFSSSSGDICSDKVDLVENWLDCNRKIGQPSIATEKSSNFSDKVCNESDRLDNFVERPSRSNNRAINCDRLSPDFEHSLNVIKISELSKYIHGHTLVSNMRPCERDELSKQICSSLWMQNKCEISVTELVPALVDYCFQLNLKQISTMS